MHEFHLLNSALNNNYIHPKEHRKPILSNFLIESTDVLSIRNIKIVSFRNKHVYYVSNGKYSVVHKADGTELTKPIG